MNDRRIMIGYGICLFIGLLAFLTVMTQSQADGALLIRENGPVEMASALGYFAAALYAIFAGGPGYLKKHGYFVLLVVGFGMRELEFYWRYASQALASDKGKGLVELKYYLNADVPMAEKMIGIIVLLAALYIVISLVKNHIAPFASDLLKRCPVTIGAALVIALLGLSQMLDKAGKFLSKAGIHLDAQTKFTFLAIEEVSEMTIPLVILVAFYAYFRQKKHS